MGFDQGQIFLTSENGAYYAGQNVSGRMVFDQEKAKDIYGIYISFKGFCKVHWTTTRKSGKTSTTVHHTSYEEYFNRKVFVFGNDNEENQLRAGHHEYNFDFQLPENIPSSFEGLYGHIRYRVKAVMHTSGIFSPNKEKRVALIVFVPVDLNLKPACREPLELSVRNSYCCCFVSAGSSEVQVKAPVGGFCPGQTIPLNVSISNLSSVEIDDIEFVIRRTIRFEAVTNPGVRFDKSTIAKISKGPVAGGTAPEWTLNLFIPPIEIFNLDSCRYIDVGYKFKVTVSTSGCHKDGKQAQQIVVGNIPLVGFQDNIMNPVQDQMPNIIPGQNIQGGNYYPAPPLILPPGPSTSNPNLNYPQTNPYLGSQPYPNPGNQLYPYSSNQPCPYPTNQPYPYPGNQSYPQPGNPPYPQSGNQPYPQPENTPYPQPAKNPEEFLPQPSSAPGFPSVNPTLPPPYPGLSQKTTDPEKPEKGDVEDLGFVLTGDGPSTPLLPPVANAPPYPTDAQSNPHAPPSAPKL